MNDCPVCFGKKDKCGHIDECASCQFAESCTWYVDNPDPEGRDGRIGGHLPSLDTKGQVVELPDIDLASKEEEECGEEEELRYSKRDIIHLLMYLHDMSEYTLRIVLKAMDGDVQSVAELARRFGDVGESRQALHAKILRECRRDRTFRAFMSATMLDCARVNEASDAKILQGRKGAKSRRAAAEISQTEFSFNKEIKND